MGVGLAVQSSSPAAQGTPGPWTGGSCSSGPVFFTGGARHAGAVDGRFVL